jgi:mannosyltransferase
MCTQRALKGVMTCAPAAKEGEEVCLQTNSPTPKRPELWPVAGSSSDQAASWGWLAALVVLAVLLRIVALNQQLWFDEIVTLLDSAHNPLSRIVTTYNSQNQHMLYSILAHYSMRWFGEQPWALRLPAVLFGVASVPALYFFGRLVTTNREALLASALMTINYQHIWFSQNARGYTGMVLWALLASIFFVRGAREGQTRDWVCYGLVGSLGIYTHLMMAFVVVGHGILYVWLLASRARSLGRASSNFFLPLYGFALSGALSLLLYGPVISRIFARTVGDAGKSVRYEWSSPVWAFWEMLRGLRTGTGGGFLAVLVGGLVLAAGLISYWRSDRFVVGLVVLPGLATAAAVLATSHNLWPRFFFFEVGFAMLFVIRGATVWGRVGARILGGTEKLGLRLSTAMVTVMILASALPLRAEYLHPKQDYLGAMKFVEDQTRPDDQVLTLGTVTTAYQRYYGRSWPLVETRAQLDADLQAGDATWLIYAMPIAVRASQPDIWEDVQAKFQIVRVFPGTLSGGEIYVCRSRDREDAHAAAR